MSGIKCCIIVIVWGLVLLTGVALATVGTLADSSGEVVAWGANSEGQTIVPAGNFEVISAGGQHSLGIKEDGTLAGWGDAYWGQTAVPAGSFNEVTAGYVHSVGVREDGTLAGWGTGGGVITPSGIFTAVSAGEYYSLGLHPDGTVVGWGDNSYGQLSIPSELFVAMVAGHRHALALRADGTLAGWGSNDSGQATVPTGTYTAIAAGGAHSLGIRDDGSLVGWGWNAWGQTNVPTGEFNAVTGGQTHSIAIRSDGTLVGWGGNYNGQTDVPAGTYVAVESGWGHNLALRARIEYDGDLLVSYSGLPYGPNGLKANLNRSINVAGDARIESWMFLRNNPTMTVGGKLTLEPGGWLAVADAGTILTEGGIEVRPGAWLFVPANLTLTSSGPLMGSGTIEVEEQLIVGLSQASTFTGNLSLWNGATLQFTGTGVITPDSISVQPNAELRLSAGQRFLIGSNFFNSGRVEVLGNGNVLGGQAEIEFGDYGYNDINALITGRDAVLRFYHDWSMHNHGAIALTGGVNDVFGDLTNYATGSIVVTGGADATFYDDIANNGTIVVRKLGGVASTAVFLGSYSGSGGTSGGGDIIFEGDLRPGHSPAAVTFANNVGFGSAATLVIEIGGLTAGNQFDVVNITGDAALAGNLIVSLIDPLGGSNIFAPSAGDTFEILTAGELLGTFDTESFPAIPGKPGLEWLIDYDTALDRVLLSVAPIFEADFDEDGDVDGVDLDVWELGYGSGSLHSQGDANGDGLVNGGDYLIWQHQFGSSIPLVAANTTVPEPAFGRLLSILVMLISSIRTLGGRRE